MFLRHGGAELRHSVSFRAPERRLSEDASPEGLIPSFRTGAVAEPAF